MGFTDDILSDVEIRPNKDNNDERQRELTYAESQKAAIRAEIEKALPYTFEEVLKSFGDDISEIPLKDGHADIQAIERFLDTNLQEIVSSIEKEDNGIGRE